MGAPPPSHRSSGRTDGSRFTAAFHQRAGASISGRRPPEALRRCLVLLIAFAWAFPSSGARSSDAAGARIPIENDVIVAGARLHVRLDPASLELPPDEIIEWVRRSAKIVAGYYGRFPVPSAELRITTVDGHGVRHGQAFVAPEPGIRLTVGREVTRSELFADWVLVHEMTHLALPEVGEAHAWLAEGLATYVEGIARVQAGNLDARELWQEDVEAMPKGMPAAGDQGLDHTHTWGRTYWGGAVFCLAADVAIHERSGNRRGLQDALRAVLGDSGGMGSRWAIERVFETGDAATGTSVLVESYRAMRDTPSAPSLASLWDRLGIRIHDGAVQLETGTPQAAIRDAIVAPRRP